MGKINRFYQPVQQQYVSQFIPENLQLMQNALNLKQSQYDKTQGKLDLYEDELLKQQALSGTDKDVHLKGLRSDFEKQTEEFLGKDLADPNVARDVGKFLREFKNDPRVSKLNEGIALKKKHDELVEKYKGVEDKYIPALDRQWLSAWDKYSNQTADEPMFAADLLRGSEVFKGGVDVYAAKEEKFANIPEDMVEQLRGISDEDIISYYKTGQGGRSTNKILGVAKTEFDDFLKEDAGRQQYLQFKEMYPDLSEKELDQKLWEDFLNTGLKRKSYKFTTTEASARNRNSDKKAESITAPVIQPNSTPLINNFKDMKSLQATINNGLKSNDPKVRNRALGLQAKTEYHKKNFVNKEIKDPKLKGIYNASRDELLSVTGLRDEAIDYIKANGPALGIFDIREALNPPEEVLRKVLIDKVYGKGYSDNIEDRLSNYLTEGSYNQTADIGFEISSSGQKAKSTAINGLSSMINNYGWQVADKEGNSPENLDAILGDINNNKLVLNEDSDGNLEFKISTKKTSDTEANEYSVIPSTDMVRDIQDPNSVSYQVVKSMFGRDEQGFKELQERVRLSDAPTVPNGSDISQTNILLGENDANNYIGNWNTQYDPKSNNEEIVLYNVDKKSPYNVQKFINGLNELGEDLSNNQIIALVNSTPSLEINKDTGEIELANGVKTSDPLKLGDKIDAKYILNMQVMLQQKSIK